MATVKRFEELQVWQRAAQQCADFFKLVEDEKFSKHFALKDQMDRSSGSVMDNIAEGFDRHSKADFRHFLVIARGSNAEFRSQLYRAFRRNILDDTLFSQLKLQSEHLGVKLHHFISYLSQSEFKQKPAAKDLSAPSLAEPYSVYLTPLHQYPDHLLY